ncbi:MAG: hypothetical protein HOE53_00710 [Candidatus Magasanikbacteria bacterium]|jgi:hypothetical protein|nr:hypothetical protein [Candidatus Magasanikbacteria bacterium]
MLKKLFYTLAVSTLALPITVAPALAAGNYGLDATANRSGLAAYGKDLPTLTGAIVGTALSVIGVVFFVLMIYGGFLWMTAHGKEELVTKAKDTIIAAIIGLILVLGAYAITSFVFNSVGGGGGAVANSSASCDSLASQACGANDSCQRITRGPEYLKCVTKPKYLSCNTPYEACVPECNDDVDCEVNCLDIFYQCIG